MYKIFFLIIGHLSSKVFIAVVFYGWVGGLYPVSDNPIEMGNLVPSGAGNGCAARDMMLATSPSRGRQVEEKSGR